MGRAGVGQVPLDRGSWVYRDHNRPRTATPPSNRWATPSARQTEDEIDHRPAEGTEGPELGDDSDEVFDLTSPNERGSDVDEDISDDEQGNPDMPTKGWTGLKTTRLNDGSHRVIKLVVGSPSATSGDIQMGEELNHVDDIEVSNLPIESIHILLSGPPDSKVRLHLISLGGVGRDVFPKQDSLRQAVDKLVKGGLPAQDEEAARSSQRGQKQRSWNSSNSNKEK